MTPAEILRHLRRLDGPLPAEALREAILRREALEPVMLEALRDSPRQLRGRGDGWMMHHYAMYLTATWRTREALTPIVGFFSHAGDLPVEVTGDFVTDSLAMVLASVAHGRLGPIRHLVENKGVSEWTRSAGINAVLVMRLTGQFTGDEDAEFIRHLVHGGLDARPGMHWDTAAILCARLHLDDTLPALERAFERGLIDPNHVQFEDVRGELAAPGSQVVFEPFPKFECLIDDPVAILSRFDWPKEDLSAEATETTEATPRRASRNDPCPCGSGRKHKHCCLKRNAAVAAAVAAGCVPPDPTLLESMMVGLDSGREGKDALACTILDGCWQLIREHLTPEMTSLDALDRFAAGRCCPDDLAYEFMAGLENAATRDPAFGVMGVAFCEFFLGQFVDEDEYNRANTRATLGLCHFCAGDAARGEALLRDLINEDPRACIGYAYLADALGFWRFPWNDGVVLDRARAVAVLEEAVAARVEDGDDYDLESRLADLREGRD
jgi:hypothetical protein